MSRRWRLSLYKAGVCSVLTYAHETWTLLVQWGKEEGPYSRLREAEPETVVEAKERRVVWRERLRKEEEKIQEEERESERVGAQRDRDKLGRMANVNVSVEIECECRISERSERGRRGV
eukprot:COSAG06_NODE_64_length_26790_cov_7.462291_9_plen_119_part_00